MREAVQIPDPCLSADLKAFAQCISEHAAAGEEFSAEGVQIVIKAFEMFAIEAKTLEDEKALLETRLLAADCRIEALTIPDFLSAHQREAAIDEGKRAGTIVDLRAIFLDEQEFNRSNDGDAA